MTTETQMQSLKYLPRAYTVFSRQPVDTVITLSLGVERKNTKLIKYGACDTLSQNGYTIESTHT